MIILKRGNWKRLILKKDKSENDNPEKEQFDKGSISKRTILKSKHLERTVAKRNISKRTIQEMIILKNKNDNERKHLEIDKSEKKKLKRTCLKREV